MNCQTLLCFSMVLACAGCRKEVAPAPTPPAAAERSAGPNQADRGPQTILDIEFAAPGGKPLRLDLHLPDRTDADAPVVLWFHGGGWVSGDKSDCPFEFLVHAGIAVASVNYRMSSEAVFPAQIHDGKAAVRFLRAHASEYGLDPERFAAAGQSAGGHMAALLATSGGIPELEGDLGNNGVSSRVQACCNFCGLIDLTTVKRPDGVQGLAGTDSPDSVESRFVGGPVQERPSVCRAANPMTYVDSADPPVLTMHGDRDNLVPLSQSEIFDRALRRAGVESVFRVVSGGGHVFDGPEVRAAVAEFLFKALNHPKKGSPEHRTNAG